MPGENPILNNPYEEPQRHYSTGVSGELDYAEIVPGRRIFTGEVQSIPVRQTQTELISVGDMEATFAPLLVNRIRREVGRWRADQYPQTTRITRELLNHWFVGERDSRLFFAQREAIETGIWLNEVAEKSNAGNFILRELEQARSIQESLPRLGFKMATGAGKTVVMAALITYHFFNRQEYGSDTRFSDNFLVIAPGVTIRDRLAVLRVDTRDGIEAEDYYSQHSLVPRNWRRRLHELNSRLVITNYHAFEPKTLQGNKRSPFDGKVGADGVKARCSRRLDASTFAPDDQLPTGLSASGSQRRGASLLSAERTTRAKRRAKTRKKRISARRSGSAAFARSRSASKSAASTISAPHLISSRAQVTSRIPFFPGSSATSG